MKNLNFIITTITMQKRMCKQLHIMVLKIDNFCKVYMSINTQNFKDWHIILSK